MNSSSSIIDEERQRDGMDWAILSNAGSREVNEDSINVIEKENEICFVVADGLGGHGKGEVASKIAVDIFKESFMKNDLSIEERMKGAFVQANQVIVNEQKKDYMQRQMKTTVVSLMIDDESALWGHIGDSRLYAFTKWGLKLRTFDHSVPQMLVVSGEIKEKEIRNHPDRNRLLRVLGVEETTLRYEVSKKTDLRKYKCYLLCTDGFWELILERQMFRCLRKAKNAQEWLEKMEAIVQEAGKEVDMDNYSAIAVWIN